MVVAPAPVKEDAALAAGHLILHPQVAFFSWAGYWLSLVGSASERHTRSCFLFVFVSRFCGARAAHGRDRSSLGENPLAVETTANRKKETQPPSGKKSLTGAGQPSVW